MEKIKVEVIEKVIKKHVFEVIPHEGVTTYKQARKYVAEAIELTSDVLRNNRKFTTEDHSIEIDGEDIESYVG